MSEPKKKHGDQLWPDGTRVADSPVVTPMSLEIDRWFFEHFHNTNPPLSTEHFNRFADAVQDLKWRLGALKEP